MTQQNSDYSEKDFETNKINVLLHYDKSFREDWRFLSRLRILVVGIFIGLASTNLGWMISKHGSPIAFHDRLPYLILHSIISITGICSMGWFGSSLNNIKRLIVKVETSLKLFKKGVYLEDDTILSSSLQNWGIRKTWHWGNSIIASIFIFLIFALAILFIKT